MPRSLGAKLALILTAVGIAGALGITILLAAIITPRFDGLEARAVAGHVERTRAALAGYAARVERTARDDAGRIGEPASLAVADAGIGTGVQGIADVAPDGHVVVARWHDRDGTAATARRAALVAAIGGIDLDRAVGRRGSARFYVRLGDGVAAVGVAPLRGAGGIPHGHVVMARTIDARRLAALLQVAARIEPGSADAVTITPGRRTTGIAVPIPGADGHAVAAVRFAVPRDVSLLGRRMLVLAIVGSTALLLIMLMVLRRAIARLVLAPLARVERHMQRVRASGSLALLADEARGDEIGALGRSFNAMLSQLQDLREQIEAQSFALGRSESAVAVMHNVRNALNPISTILGQGIAQGPAIDRATLDRAMAELRRDDVPAERREQLAAFVTAALDAEENARRARRAELEVGREAMAQVLEIIGEQQARAHDRPELAMCDVTDIVARNAAIVRYAPGLSIAFAFPASPHPVMANRVILSQVIGNLFGNAAEAIAARGTASGSIAVTIEEHAARVAVTIRDDGEGFAADVAPTLFRRGFSTRTHKSGGLGLHWCANAVAAMGGTLELRSAGKGLGAEAIVTLDAAGEGPGPVVA